MEPREDLMEAQTPSCVARISACQHGGCAESLNTHQPRCQAEMRAQGCQFSGCFQTWKSVSHMESSGF